MIVAGGDEQLGNLAFIEVFANGKIARRSEGAEHQKHLVFLDEIARQFHGGGGIGFVVVGDEAHLAAIDAAALVDQIEIGRFGLADRAEHLKAPAVGHEIADADFVVGNSLLAHALGDCSQRRQRHADGQQEF